MNLIDRLRDHKEALLEAAEESTFIVFLCGPKLEDKKLSSTLRASIKSQLESNGFEVVLGEDDGLENTRLHLGINAQDNELEFIRRYCNAVIVIADSVGAFCELSLFSWHFVHENGVIENGSSTDFIVLVDRQYESDKSYLNEGPINAIAGFGQVHFVDFATYTTDQRGCPGRC